jgi:O-antigen ligase
MAVFLLSLTITATLSRSAISGLIVAGTWAWATGRLRVSLRLALILVSVAAFVGLVAFRLGHNQVETALVQKQHIANTNIEHRFESWEVALREFSASPVLGVGTGNYQNRYHEFLPPADLEAGLAKGVTVTHSVYLSILAELGLPGLGIFVSFLAYSWSRLRRRLPDPDTDALLSAIAAGFLIAVVAGFFLDEQYYMQLWFLPALGATLPSHRAGREAPLPQGRSS